MSGPVDPNYKGPVRMQPHKPWEITPRRCHTPEMVKELKILINEVLDEREGKFNYTSYFDVDDSATKAQIKKAFVKSLKTKKLNKKILGEFIELVV